MELARYVVDTVVLEGRSCWEAPRSHGVSKSWVAKLVVRYREGGYEAIAPRSKAAEVHPPRGRPDRVAIACPIAMCVLLQRFWCCVRVWPVSQCRSRSS